jgi:hypothetical protein
MLLWFLTSHFSKKIFWSCSSIHIRPNWLFRVDEVLDQWVGRNNELIRTSSYTCVDCIIIHVPVSRKLSCIGYILYYATVFVSFKHKNLLQDFIRSDIHFLLNHILCDLSVYL